MIKNYFNFKKILDLKNTLYLLVVFFAGIELSNAQCATPIAGCSNTDLSNFGAASNNNATTIEYDNFVSSWHTTIVRTSDGSFQTWGETISNTGANQLAPVTINRTNFPALSAGAVPLKAALGSTSSNNVQGILLATDGLYAWSKPGMVLDASLTTSAVFQKLTIGGNTNGLPAGVAPGDVKMMFGTYKTLAITTCSGDVWVISQTAAVRGNGALGNNTTWYRVRTSEAGNPFLTDVVACRGNNDGLMALKSDGTVYVWGVNVFLGNSTVAATQNYAAPMSIPVGITPKMIGSTGNGTLRSHYILATDGSLYALGNNTNRQLGDWSTATERLAWVQPRYNSSSTALMNDVKWFSPQEHDSQYAAINVLTNGNKIYAFGNSNGSLLGIGSGTANNPTTPGGLLNSDNILAVETGGHTSMLVKSCETKFGYVGHRISGSMGDGTSNSTNETSYTFATANVQICGAESNPAIQPISTGGGPDSKYCVDDPVLLNPTPAGGTLSIVSGPGSLSGNTLNFTAVGTVSVQYTVTTSCGGTSVTTRSFDAALCPADLEITKVADNSIASVGNTVVFTITAKNNGPYKATGVTVNDVLPSGYSLVSAVPSSGTWSAPNWTIGSLANGESTSLSVTTTVNATGSYSNTASISGNNPDGTAGNDSATAAPVVQADLSVTKSVNNATPSVGSTVTFTITASNAGPSTATGVNVTDVLPSGYTFVSATPSTGTWSAPDWNIGNLANGASTTLTMEAVVKSTGIYANTASISGEESDVTLGNNSETITPTINNAPAAVKDIYTVAEDNTVTLTPLINDSDIDGDALSIVSINGTALTGSAQVITVPDGIVNISASGVITFTPSADFNSAAPVSFPYVVTDGSLTASANIEITVTAVNDAPIANDDTNNIIVSTAGATTINALTASDVDGTIANYTILTLPPDGVLSLMGTPIAVGQILTPAEATMITYTPSGTFTGNVMFTFTASDDLGLTAVTPGTITIPIGNNAPAAHDNTNSNIPSRAGATAIKALTATDTDGTIINYIVTTLPAHGVLALSGVPVTVNQTLTPAEAAMLTYDPSGAFSGNDTFTFTATDNNGAVDATPATITITVDKTTLVATPDPIGTVVGINEVVEIVNVLTNDTLNNDPLLPIDVKLDVLVKDPNNVLTLKPDGTVELIPNAPAGNYSLTYEICEKANPSNCTSAIVSVTVEAPKMTVTANSYCSDNTPYVSYNVKADNFTPKGLLTINWIDSANNIVATQTNMPLSGNVLWPGAVVDSNNKPIDWPGWVLVNGQWIEGNDGFELTRPAVTMQFTLNPTESVTVNYPAPSSGCNARPYFGIEAENDNDNITADGINGSAELINVLDNDKLNGAPVNPADVILTPNNFPAGITLNSDGTIDVAPGTKGGSHTLTYQICEKANPLNCSDATVNIFVEVPSITLVMKVELNDQNKNDNAEAGETLTYTYTITNNGNVPLQNITISNLLPGIIITGGPISLAVGESDSHTFTGTYTLTQADINAGKVVNQATASGTTLSGIKVEDKSDSNNDNGDAPTEIDVNGCQVKIYNAVSLNGDDMNERFYIRGIECYPDNTVQIFNRWGVLIFERDHYNNNDVVFKGFSEGRTTIKESNGLPEGTYYYIVRYKDNNSSPKQEAGYLYLTK